MSEPVHLWQLGREASVQEAPVMVVVVQEVLGLVSPHLMEASQWELLVMGMLERSHSLRQSQHCSL